MLLLPPLWQWASQPEALQCENFQQNKQRDNCKRVVWQRNEYGHIQSCQTEPEHMSWHLSGHVHVHVQPRDGHVVRQRSPLCCWCLLCHGITECPSLEGTHGWVTECLELMRDPGSIPHLIVVNPFFGFCLLSSATLPACAAKLGPVFNHVSLETGATLAQPYIQKLRTLHDCAPWIRQCFTSHGSKL